MYRCRAATPNFCYLGCHKSWRMAVAPIRDPKKRETCRPVCSLFEDSFGFVLLRTVFPEFTFAPPSCHPLLASLYLCICESLALGLPVPCLFREASQKHKSKRQDKFRRSAAGSWAGTGAGGRRINFRPSFSLYCRDLCLARHWARGVLAKKFFGLREKLFTPAK